MRTCLQGCELACLPSVVAFAPWNHSLSSVNSKHATYYQKQTRAPKTT